METLIRIEGDDIIETTVVEPWAERRTGNRRADEAIAHNDRIDFWGTVVGIAITAAAVFLLGAAWAYYCLGGPR
jgi:hypothetical protein